jgi:two-component sensor histidine kinase
MTSQRSFPATAGSIREARRFVLDQLPQVADAMREQVGLIVSELVTNAIVHASSSYTVALDLEPQTLTLEVADQGNGLPFPADAPPPPDQHHGRGLLIVTQLATEWGVKQHSGDPGKTVWVKLPLSPRGRRASTEPSGNSAHGISLPRGSSPSGQSGSESNPTARLRLAA